MKTVRLSKIAMTSMLASLAFMLMLNNILDYGSNYTFVQHVLSMDSTFPSNSLMYRAVTSETLWNLSYWVIIGGEGLICLFFLMGTGHLWCARNATGMAFNHAKKWIYVGAVMTMLLWFFGFMVIGGEYFLMWQSTIWNEQEPAFRVYMSVLAVLIFVNQKDTDL